MADRERTGAALSAGPAPAVAVAKRWNIFVARLAAAPARVISRSTKAIDKNAGNTEMRNQKAIRYSNCRPSIAEAARYQMEPILFVFPDHAPVATSNANESPPEVADGISTLIAAARTTKESL